MKRAVQFAVLAVSLFIATDSFATGVLKLDLAPTPESGNFLLYSSIFGTRGTQTTNVSFASSLAGFAPLSGAQFDLSGVDVLSPLFAPGAEPQTVKTLGGDFALYAADQTLLLSGHLGDGQLSVSFDADTGSYFNLSFGTFTGGTLAHLFAPNTLGVSIALTNFRSFGEASLYNQLYLVSDGSVVIRGHDNNVPEPASVLLFGMGFVGAALARRQRAAE